MDKKATILGISSLVLSYGFYNLYRLADSYDVAKHFWTIGLYCMVVCYSGCVYLLIDNVSNFVKRVWLCVVIFQIVALVNYVLIHFILLDERGVLLLVAWGKWCGKSAASRVNIVFGVASSIVIPALCVVLYMFYRTSKEGRKVVKDKMTNGNNSNRLVEWGSKIVFGAIIVYIASVINGIDAKLAVMNQKLCNVEAILEKHERKITDLEDENHVQDKLIFLLKNKVDG